MKVIILVLTLAAFSEALEAEDFKLDFDKNLIRELIQKYEKGLKTDRAGSITAIVDEFADKILGNIGRFAINNHLDPLPLGNISENFLVADVELTDGELHGISNIKRYQDVVVTYQSSLKLLTIELPLQFSNISFTYDYLIKVIGIGPTGDLLGEIDNFKLYLQLNFDFTTLTASIGKLKTTDSGHISFTAHGNLTDIIFNILSQFITTILHPLLQGIIEGIVKSVANQIVDDVNDFIYNVTHQNYTQYNEVEQYYLKYIN